MTLLLFTFEIQEIQVEVLWGVFVEVFSVALSTSIWNRTCPFEQTRRKWQGNKVSMANVIWLAPIKVQPNFNRQLYVNISWLGNNCDWANEKDFTVVASACKRLKASLGFWLWLSALVIPFLTYVIILSWVCTAHFASRAMFWFLTVRPKCCGTSRRSMDHDSGEKTI